MKIVGLFDHSGLRPRQDLLPRDQQVSGPYRVDLLMSEGIDLRAVSPVRNQLHRKVRDVVEHRSSVPMDLALRALPQLPGADGVLAFLEDKAVFPAWLKQNGIPPYSKLPLTTLSCWWAEELRHGSPAAVRRISRTLEHVDHLICFSRNQTKIFTDHGVSAHRVHPVTFGVDQDFYTPGPVTQEFQVLAAGVDRGRDYNALVATARLLPEVRFDVFTQPGRITEPPPNLTCHAPVSLPEHRENLRSAQLVVIPTHDLAYPTGQSILLEAMACGTAAAATHTTAMAEYLEDGVSNLALPSDPAGIAAVIDHALSAPDRTHALGARARRVVQERFTFRRLWHDVAAILRGASLKPGDGE